MRKLIRPLGLGLLLGSVSISVHAQEEEFDVASRLSTGVAERHTVEFAVEGQETLTITFDSATMILTVGDVTVPFTVDEAKGEEW